MTIPLLAGAAFILGGAAFDIYATLHHSPDLEHEANPLPGRSWMKDWRRQRC
ncbi:MULTISPECIES: hypothetical protein [unclassified Pseudoxanthomonas]|uniref:hypothetical protein n=1 Tax=unclassified Pseudoxanthomonas TaxID=2645906 RepID=UPI00160E64E2|nr:MULTISPECIES: hypothetical protein [unclassified Pseudoxanthomonas]MBB3275413.1 hypothetical protein [Pseudoxanthomonas sp. OG2]MBV7473497.1 hypothetical protein [Pseudoxanthomonas sp. PXM05]